MEYQSVGGSLVVTIVSSTYIHSSSVDRLIDRLGYYI